MSYKKSAARVSFDFDCAGLLKLSREVSFKRINLNHDHKNMVFVSAIILLCAYEEKYISNVFQDIFSSYRSNNVRYGDLPEATRAYAHLLRHRKTFAKYNLDNDEQKAFSALKITSQEYKSLVNPDSYFNYQVNAYDIIARKKYPSSANMKTLFARFGISPFFDVINGRGRRNFRLEIDSFQSIRTSIAHSGAGQVTKEDVIREIDRASALINIVDRTLCSHVCKTASKIVWSTICDTGFDLD